MGVTLWVHGFIGKARKGALMLARMARGPLARPGFGSLPQNHRLPPVFRLGDDESWLPAADGLTRDPRLARVEAALLVADEPLSARRLAAVAELKDALEARRLARRLQELYQKDQTAFQIEEVAGGFQLLTQPQFHPWLVRLRRTGTEIRLSPAARETLAIIAYRQPIMRAEIEGIRGVQCGEILRQLMEKGFISLAGRHDSLGRPVLYGTTKRFLQAFGLRGLKDLPQAEQLRTPEKK
jgi:segregation and condensation protein B